MSVHSIKQTPPEDAPSAAVRSPERQALADAIALKQKCDKQLTAHRQAIERARENVEKCEAALETARSNISKALDADAKIQVNTIKSGRTTPAASRTSKARQSKVDAIYERAVAKDVLQRLKDGLDEEEVVRADLAIGGAINALLATIAPPLIERLERLKLEIPVLQAQLYFIRNRGYRRQGTGAVGVDELRAPLAGIEKRIMETVEIGPPSFHCIAAEQSPAVEPLRAWCRALMENADAALE
jgi:exonuclease VII small subunit